MQNKAIRIIEAICELDCNGDIGEYTPKGAVYKIGEHMSLEHASFLVRTGKAKYQDEAEHVSGCGKH